MLGRRIISGQKTQKKKFKQGEKESNNPINKWAVELDKLFLKEEVEIAHKNHHKFNLTSLLERKVKNRLRSRITPVRMAVIKKINNKKFCKCVDKEKPHILLVGMETSPATIRVNIEISQKKKKTDKYKNKKTKSRFVT